MGLDLRSLALLRIGLACVVLVDLAIRSGDLTAHYSDDGLLPRRALLEHLADRWHFSLHVLGGPALFQVALFTLAGLAACCLGLGFFTGPASFACWLLTISLQNRNPMLLSGADVMLRMVLFWGMFLPWGARLSLDGLRAGKSQTASNSALSAGTAAYTLQMIAVYVFAGLIKLDVPAWLNGTGVAYALRAPAFATALAGALVEQRSALTTLSTLVPQMELWSPLLLLVPFRTELFRALCVALFWALHIAIALVLDVGIFVPVCLVAWSAFLPAWTWDHLMPAAARQLAALSRLAVVRTCMDLFARLRAQLVASLPAPDGSASAAVGWLTRGRTLLCATLAAYVFAWNLWVLREPPPLQIPEALRWIGPLLRIDQRWDMFSRPITESGWFVIPARLSSGAELDLATRSRQVTWQRPAALSRNYPNDRWRKYTLNLAAAQHAQVRLYFGQFLCRSWNAEHSGPETLEAFKVYFMMERIVPWSAALFVKKEVIWEHECSAGLLKRWRDVL